MFRFCFVFQGRGNGGYGVTQTVNFIVQHTLSCKNWDPISSAQAKDLTPSSSTIFLYSSTMGVPPLPRPPSPKNSTQKSGGKFCVLGKRFGGMLCLGLSLQIMLLLPENGHLLGLTISPVHCNNL